MKIWKLNFEVDEFDNLIPVKKFTADQILLFDGRKMKDNWKPLPVKRAEPERGLKLSDAPGFTIPVNFQGLSLNWYGIAIMIKNYERVFTLIE